MTAQEKYESLSITQRFSDRVLGPSKSKTFAKDLDNIIDVLAKKYELNDIEIRKLIAHYTS